MTRADQEWIRLLVMKQFELLQFVTHFPLDTHGIQSHANELRAITDNPPPPTGE